MARNKWVTYGIGMAAALTTSVVSYESQAVNERWYMMHTCIPIFDNPSTDVNNNWGPNEFGFVNLHLTASLGLMCPQPHLFGNNGHGVSTAVYLDRHTVGYVQIELCRNNGSNGDVVSQFFTSGSGFTSANPQTASFLSTVDGTRSYYYWVVYVPDHDPPGPSGGYSALVSMLFNDN